MSKRLKKQFKVGDRVKITGKKKTRKVAGSHMFDIGTQGTISQAWEDRARGLWEVEPEDGGTPRWVHEKDMKRIKPKKEKQEPIPEELPHKYSVGDELTVVEQGIHKFSVGEQVTILKRLKKQFREGYPKYEAENQDGLWQIIYENHVTSLSGTVPNPCPAVEDSLKSCIAEKEAKEPVFKIGDRVRAVEGSDLRELEGDTLFKVFGEDKDSVFLEAPSMPHGAWITDADQLELAKPTVEDFPPGTKAIANKKNAGMSVIPEGQEVEVLTPSDDDSIRVLGIDEQGKLYIQWFLPEHMDWPDDQPSA